MARLIAEVPSCLLSEPDPALAIQRLNQLLSRAGLSDRFVTFVVAVLDCLQHSLTIVNAGHLAPILRRAGTNALEEIATGDIIGLPLGVADTYEYQSCRVDLAPGDSVILCTDGISDAMNEHEGRFGTRRLLGALQSGPTSAQLLGKNLLKAVELHAAGQPQHDDITLVIFGRDA
jgi:serine phosphatase RsbU (regulator of sigma subunit)